MKAGFAHWAGWKPALPVQICLKAAISRGLSNYLILFISLFYWLWMNPHAYCLYLFLIFLAFARKVSVISKNGQVFLEKMLYLCNRKT